MKSNVWLTVSWFDYQLKWDPAEYHGIKVNIKYNFIKAEGIKIFSI